MYQIYVHEEMCSWVITCFFTGLQMVWTAVIGSCNKHIFNSSSFCKPPVFVHKKGNILMEGLNED